MSQLALGTIGRSRSLINQSQESLDPGDHYDHSDREEGEEHHQQDADDEDDSGLVSLKLLNERRSLQIHVVLFHLQLQSFQHVDAVFPQGSGKRLRVPGKSSRKRLNPQASVDSIEQWKAFNMSPSDLQVLIINTSWLILSIFISMVVLDSLSCETTYVFCPPFRERGSPW